MSLVAIIAAEPQMAVPIPTDKLRVSSSRSRRQIGLEHECDDDRCEYTKQTFNTHQSA